MRKPSILMRACTPAWLCLAVLAATLASTTPAAACELRQSPQYRLKQIPSEVGGEDIVRVISLDTDGCLQVHFPAFDRRAGRWSMQLDASALAQLRPVLAALEPLDFDAAVLAGQRRRIDQQLRLAADDRPQISYVAGASRHVLELHPDTPAARTLAWTALEHDAGRYRELPELATLWSAVQALMQLSESSGLQRQAPQS